MLTFEPVSASRKVGRGLVSFKRLFTNSSFFGSKTLAAFRYTGQYCSDRNRKTVISFKFEYGSGF
jgi:hypothetical protein